MSSPVTRTKGAAASDAGMASGRVGKQGAPHLGHQLVLGRPRRWESLSMAHRGPTCPCALL